MAWTGSAPNQTFVRTNGVYNGATVWQQDDGVGESIEAVRMDTHDYDISEGLNLTLKTDGGNKMTAGLPGFAGTVSLPGYSFSTDQNLGIYRIGADNLGVSCGGVKQVDISTTAATFTPTILFASGTELLPGLAPSADGDTGLWYHSADNLAVSAGGVKSLQISDSYVRAFVQLSAPNDGTAAAPSITFEQDFDTGILRPAANTIAWSTDGTERMRLDSAGDFMIGVTSVIDPEAGSATGLSFDESLGVLTVSDPNGRINIRDTDSTAGHTWMGFYWGTTLRGRIEESGGDLLYTNLSDAREKEWIETTLEPGSVIDKIADVLGQWRWKDIDGGGFSTTAQKLYSVFPGAVAKGGGTRGRKDYKPWGIDWSKPVPALIAYVVSGFRRSDARTDELERRLAALEKKR